MLLVYTNNGATKLQQPKKFVILRLLQWSSFKFRARGQERRYAPSPLPKKEEVNRRRYYVLFARFIYLDFTVLNDFITFHAIVFHYIELSSMS